MMTLSADWKAPLFELVGDEVSDGMTLDEAYAFLTGADTNTFGVPKIVVAGFWGPRQERQHPRDAGGQFTDVDGEVGDSFAGRLRDAATGAALRAQVSASTAPGDQSLTLAERDSVLNYTTGLFKFINNGLRGSRGSVRKIQGIPDTGPTEVGNTASLRRTVEVIDKIHARSHLKSDARVLRGVADPGRVFGRHWSDGDVTGLTWTEYGYSSTTDDGDLARSFARGGVVLDMLVPAGTGALHNAEPYGEDTRSEYLLERGLRYRVRADRGVVGGVRLLDVEVSRV